jgi:transposase-like protein
MRRRFPVKIILLCVRWYCKYRISYRDLSEMMYERGVNVDPQHHLSLGAGYAPEFEKRVRKYQGTCAGSCGWMRPMCRLAIAGNISFAQ